ncbi:MAG: nucleotidyl transferase AbiEii/AbiGii toxin family protein [Candidatus Peribacteria bacterium]|nr:nucleotidyl transferase AbiEii/AbiGii toxin family protein [Candidatus Peribacteria bacterium]
MSYGEKDVNINIDINRKVLKNYNYIFLNLYGITVKVQDKATIFTNKLFALSQRNVNRDIYDVHFFLKNAFPIDEKAVREKT